MSRTPLEDALTRTLSVAAERAPQAPPQFSSDVDLRYRRRRNRRYTVAACVAVVAVTAGSVAVSRELLPGPDRTYASALDVPTLPVQGGGKDVPPLRVDGKEVPPIAEVWPDAVRKVPARLPDGRNYFPVTFADDDTLILVIESGFEQASELWRYDLEAERATRVAAVPTLPGTTIFASDFVAGEGRIAWWTARKSQDGEVAQIWTAPLAGGEATQIATTRLAGGTDGDGIERLTIADGTVAWSTGAEGGVYQVPLSGGQARLVPGTEGHDIVIWPWIGSPRIPRDGYSSDTRLTVYRELRNLKTGEQRSAEDTGDGFWHCAVTWCVGSSADGRAVAQHRDGSGRSTLPGEGSMRHGPALDRFMSLWLTLPGTRGGGEVLYDLRTGRMGDFGNRPNAEGSIQGAGISDNPAERLVSWKVDGGKRYMILDLAAIK